MKQPLSAPTSFTWHRPTEQQILLLHAALFSEEAALAAWRAWRLTADLDQLPPGGFGLLPLLVYNLQPLGIVDPLLDQCQGIHRRTWTQNQLYIRQVATLIQALQEGQVKPLLYDEMLLALAYYPAQGLRMIQQVHLVTPADQGAATQACLNQAGWRPRQTPKAWIRGLVVGGAHPQRLQQAGSDLTLAWQQAVPNAYPPLATDLWQQAHPLTINGVATEGVSPTDLFLMVCTQGIADLWRFGAVQWLADATMLLRTATIDWARLGALATQQAFTLRLTAALQGLHQWVDAPLPAASLAAITRLPVQPFERWEAQCDQRLPSTLGKGSVLWLAARRRRWVRQI